MGQLIRALILFLGGTLLLAKSHLAYFHLQLFEKEIKQYPFFDLIYQHHPKAFKLFLSQAKNQLADPDKIAMQSFKLVNQIFPHHLQSAPNDAILHYLKATHTLYAYLYKTQPEAIFTLERPNHFTPWQDDPLLRNHLENLLKSKHTILKKAPLPSSPLLPEKKHLKLIAAFFATLSPHTPFCDLKLILHFYDQLLSLDPTQAGEIVRYMAYLKALRHTP